MYHFIINPHSRTGLGLSLWKKVEQYLKKRKIKYTYFLTEYNKHATEEVAKLTSGSASVTLVVLGGDGTLNEVVNGIQNFSNVTIGYIPTGSSNDFCRGMGLPTNPKKALENILTSKSRRQIDVGCATTDTKSSRFLVSCGIGFDALIGYQVGLSKWKKTFNQLNLGRLIYAFIAIQQLFFYKTTKLKLTLNDTSTFTFDKNYFVSVMNMPCEGGGLRFTPEADPEDRTLNLCVISNMLKLKILTLLPTAFSGRHVGFKGVDIQSCSSLAIETDIPCIVHADGEFLGMTTSLSVDLHTESLNFIN